MTVHIANINFEEELCENGNIPYEKAIQKHPFYLQLQFLPLLYADPDDLVLVSHLPPVSYLEGLSFKPPHIALLSSTIPPSYIELKSWGYSKGVADYAKEKGLLYLCPEMETVKKVHSKAYPLENAPKKAGSCLLKNEKEVEDWLKKEPFPKVLKKVLGASGRGHLVLMDEKDLPKISSFLRNAHFPLRGERWLNKVLEFSTQWEVGEKNTLLGTTIFKSSPKGSYQSTIVGRQEEIPYIAEHLEIASEFLKKVYAQGYFGPMGLDAFIYEENGKTYLYPILESNARRTMSWAALQIQRRYFLNEKMTFSYLPSIEPGLLPSYLEIDGKKVHFSNSFSFVLG
ncbi:MAG TPA: hypothetical protein VLG44_05155 [Chlamydiales bacterium]|nr:hypothetical protein [Chlamydiales bacterium]